MFEQVFLLLMIVIAIFTIETKKLNRAVIYMCCLSLLASLMFYMLHAPDVAMAEAAIGSALGTIIFLAAIKKKREFTIISRPIEPFISWFSRDEDLKSAAYLIKGFCLEEEMHIRIHLSQEDNIQEQVIKGGYDLAVRNVENNYYLDNDYVYNFYVRDRNFLMNRLKKHIDEWNKNTDEKVILSTMKAKEID